MTLIITPRYDRSVGANDLLLNNIKDNCQLLWPYLLCTLTFIVTILSRVIISYGLLTSSVLSYGYLWANMFSK